MTIKLSVKYYKKTTDHWTYTESLENLDRWEMGMVM